MLLFFPAVYAGPSAIARQDASDICDAVATLASNAQLAKRQLPADPPDDKSTLRGASPDAVYRIRLTDGKKRSRFARFFTGGSCASYNIYNIDGLEEFNSSVYAGNGVGMVRVKDPEDMIRWATWGGTEYLIRHDSRYLVISADLRDLNRPTLVSWIRPDGLIQPLCSFSEVARQRVASEGLAECPAILGGLQPLPWTLVDDSSSLYRTHAGESPRGLDSVEVSNIDSDAGEHVIQLGRFSYSSGAGCGSDYQWFALLADGARDTTEGPLARVINTADDVLVSGKTLYATSDNTLIRLTPEIEKICSYSTKKTFKPMGVYEVE